jgi:hypothetical protein
MSDGRSVNKPNIEIILREEILVFCKNKNAQRFRIMPFKILYEANSNFWRQDETWEFYFTQDAMGKLKEKNIITQIIPESSDEKNTKNLQATSFEKAFGNDYITIAAMTNTEKVKYLNDIKHKMDELVAMKTRDKTAATKTMIDTAKDAIIINHSALENVYDLGDAEAKRATQTLVHTTHEMAKSYTQLVSQNIFDNDLMNRLIEKSNGTIVQHMTRVYLNGIAFLAYYNKFVSNRVSIINMRKTLNARYRQYYHTLLPHFSAEDIVLERVFQKGMIPIPPDLFVKWVVGFLIHDIGKADAVEYHEGEDSYDRNIVMEHVKLGYNSVMNKTNYPMEASLITGYHHEYYGNATGYGYFRDYLEHHKKTSPQAKPEYCMTFDLEPMQDCHALAYFPAKILEIVDVYDSVTDPNRIYRKALSSEEALSMMREEFITKNLKIDPILFELFTGLIRKK